MTAMQLPSMSATESLILELLRGRERYGLELVDRSSGALKRGSVYVTLARMEAKGFVESYQEERSTSANGLPRRRLYRATEYGCKVHDAYQLLREALGLRPAAARA
jgi:DNA-binding PadR family transcriptional regulator